MIKMMPFIKDLFDNRSQAKKSRGLRDLGDPDQSLAAIAFKLADEIFNLDQGEMISKKLQDSLQTLSPKERAFVVNCHNNVYDFTPFIKACEGRLTPVVEYMCQTSSPDLLSLVKYENTELEVSRTAPALWHTVVANCLPVVKVLLEAGADINAVSDTGSTPINSACFLNLEDMVEFLIDAGADINIPNNNGGTCLMNAVGHVGIVKMLVEHGADIYARDCFQKTVLHYAIEEVGHETLAYLLENDTNQFQIDENDHEHYQLAAAICGQDLYNVFMSVERVRIGSNLGRDADCIEILGCTAFEDGDPDFIHLWQTAYALRREYGVKKTINTPIAHFELRSECVSKQQLLTLQSPEHFLYETLMIYMRVLGPTHYHFLYALDYFFSHSDEQDCLAANRIGFLLMNLMIQKHGLLDGRVSQTSYLLIEHCFMEMDHGHAPNFTVLFETLKLIRIGIEALKAGIDQAPEPEQERFDWALNFILLLLYVIVRTAEPRQLAIATAYVGIHLLANGREEDQLRTANGGFTLLHLAASKCNGVQYMTGKSVFPSPEVVNLLLTCGAPVNAVASDGSSPLFVAAASVNYMKEIVELLLRNGAHCDQVGPGGDTAMEVLRRCLDPSNGDLEPPINLPTVVCLE